MTGGSSTAGGYFACNLHKVWKVDGKILLDEFPDIMVFKWCTFCFLICKIFTVHLILMHSVIPTACNLKHYLIFRIKAIYL